MVGLPATWTTFVGRAAELEELSQALSSNRLVTLVGPGGVGKTRLAVVAASDNAGLFAGGGVFVDLVPVSPEFVLHAVAAALGVVERPQDPLEQVVHERLRAGRILLVLDNCEHVLGAVADLVRSVLASCPDVVVLATSRERLGIAGERVVPLSPLGLTASTDGGDESEAARLFTDRAGRADADPAVVAEICRRRRRHAPGDRAGRGQKQLTGPGRTAGRTRRPPAHVEPLQPDGRSSRIACAPSSTGATSSSTTPSAPRSAGSVSSWARSTSAPRRPSPVTGIRRRRAI